MHADFNPAALEVIDFLGGDRSTGMCFCPCHDDGEKPSLQVNNGDKVPIVLHCFGNGTKEHDLEVIAYLQANKKWPTSSALSRDQSSSQATLPKGSAPLRPQDLEGAAPIAAGSRFETPARRLPTAAWNRKGSGDGAGRRADGIP
jgi:hypothetical protein